MPAEKKTERKVLSAEQFEALPSGEAAGLWLEKAEFFKLVSLKDMSRGDSQDPRSIDAAESTFVRWVQTGRVKEERVVVEDPSGNTPDQVTVYIEARYVNSERRREGQQRRRIEEARAAMQNRLPPALRS